MDDESLESNLKDYSDEELRLWERKWRRFHKSLPNKIIFNDGFILYKQDSGLYSSVSPERRYKKILKNFVNYLASKFL